MVAMPEVQQLERGLDLRRPEYRREVFLRFYLFHTRYGTHPGCVYFLIPYLAERLGWDEEQLLWFAFLNGNTQNPVTSYLLHRAGSRPADAAAVIDFYSANYYRLAFDTDRRHHKNKLAAAIDGYLATVGSSQARFWSDVSANGFEAVWKAASGVPYFGRLSAWSYCDYLHIAGVNVECNTLMLEDRDGSRSHRNGIAKVLGMDQFDWHDSNPGFDGKYPPDLLRVMAAEGNRLLREARDRVPAGAPWARDLTLLTLESALCTYKSWHRPNRRYPNVYADMLHARIKTAEAAFPEVSFDIFWEARADRLPPHLRLEDNPGDPGVKPLKQNWYRETGQVIMMEHDYPELANDFEAGVREQRWGTFR